MKYLQPEGCYYCSMAELQTKIMFSLQEFLCCKIELQGLVVYEVDSIAGLRVRKGTEIMEDGVFT
jgi:hypothetical protein